MKIKIASRGGTEFDANPEYVEPMLRELIGDDHPNIAAAIIDCTDTERDHDHYEYATVTEDDGTVLWSGWLDGGDEPAPDAAEAERDALRLLLGKARDMARSWTEIDDGWGAPTPEALAEAEYGRQLLTLLDGDPDAP